MGVQKASAKHGEGQQHESLAMIDTAFDFRTDAGAGDPDTHSPTLRRYHRLLWSKPLPSGAAFDLDDATPGVYLHHRSEVGEFFLASDSVIPTFTRWAAMQPIVTQLPEADNEAFRTLGYTIGGMLVFPGNRVDGKQTLKRGTRIHPQDRRQARPHPGVHPTPLSSRGQAAW